MFLSIFSLEFQYKLSANDYCPPVSSADISLTKSISNSFKQSEIAHIYVVDITGSMNRGGSVSRWDELFPKFIRSLEEFPFGQGRQCHLILFGGAGWPGNLRWSYPGTQSVNVPETRTSAYSFLLDSAQERAALLNTVKSIERPRASMTPLYDALRSAYEKALELKAQGVSKILINVYTDGADNASKTRQNELVDLEKQALDRLSGSLLGDGYLFVTVGSGSVKRPTAAGKALTMEPEIVMASMSPGQLQIDRFQSGGEAQFFKVLFELQGEVDIPLDLRFDPDPGFPPARLVCRGGMSAKVLKSGWYELGIVPVSDLSQYDQGLQGTVQVLSPSSLSSSGNTLFFQNLTPEGVRINMPTKPVGDPPKVKPSNRSRFLSGDRITFEAEALDGVNYEWSFSGLVQGSSDLRQVDHLVQSAGTVRFEVQGRHKTVVVPPVSGSIEVLDPEFDIIINPANPAAGERVNVSLSSNGTVDIRRVEWTPGPQSMDSSDSGASAEFVFQNEGDLILTAAIETELGSRSLQKQLNVLPGLRQPTLVTPAQEDGMIRMFRSEESTDFIAEISAGAVGARFEWIQNNSVVAGGDAESIIDPNDPDHPTATWSLKADVLAAGQALLRIRALTDNPDLEKRIGIQQAEYPIQILDIPFYMYREEPLDSYLEWEMESLFVAALKGPGRNKVEGLEWKWIRKSADGSEQVLSSSIVKADQAKSGDDVDYYEFPFTPFRDQPPFSTAGNAGLTLIAEPMGDRAVVSQQLVKWEGVAPVDPPVEAVLQCPGIVGLNQSVEASLKDQGPGQLNLQGEWSVSAPNGSVDLGAAAAGSSTRWVATVPGSYRVQVRWRNQVFETRVDVQHDPLRVESVTWDGGQRARVVRRNASRDDSLILRGDISGDEAGIRVTVSEVVDGKVGSAIPGFDQKLVNPADLAQGIEIPYPASSLNNGPGEYLVQVKTVGLDWSGKKMESPEEYSFTILNQPPHRYWLWFIILAGAAGIWKLLKLYFTENEVRWHELRCVPGTGTEFTADSQIRRACMNYSRAENEEDAWQLKEIDRNTPSFLTDYYDEFLNEAGVFCEPQQVAVKLRRNHNWKVRFFKTMLVKASTARVMGDTFPEWAAMFNRSCYLKFSRNQSTLWQVALTHENGKRNHPDYRIDRVDDANGLCVYRINHPGNDNFFYLLLWNGMPGHQAQSALKSDKKRYLAARIILVCVTVYLLQNL